MRSLRERYEAGEGCRELAEDIGCSPSTVWLRLKKQGTTFRPRGGKAVGFDLGEAIHLYREGSSCSDLATHFQCSPMVVWRRLTKAGLSLRKPGGVVKIDGETVRSLYASGQTMQEVAKELGCTSPTVLRHLRQGRGPTRSRSEAQTLDLDIDAILAAYNNDTALSDIAETMGCSQTAIRTRLDDLGAPPRPRATHQKVILDEDALIRLYLTGLPSTALQSTFECSYATILKRLRGCGIPVRGSGSYSRKEVDVDTLVDLYLDGWSANRVAAHLGCSAHLVLDRLDERGVARRSGSPHGGICVHNGVVVKTDSGWESHVYTLLRDWFGDSLRFQGEFGDRVHLRTRTFDLTKPDLALKKYLPNRPNYRWTPDFFIPEEGLHLEVKGWHAREKWDSVIVPAILHSKQPSKVAVLLTSPYRLRDWAALKKALHYIT